MKTEGEYSHMKSIFNGWTKVFRFTFMQNTSARAYRITTIVLGLLLFVIPVISFQLAFQNKDEKETKSTVDTVYVCDNSSLKTADYSLVNNSGNELYSHIEYRQAVDDISAAVDTAGNNSSHSLVLYVENAQKGFSISVVRPEGSKVTEREADYFASFFEDNFIYVLVSKTALNSAQLHEITWKSAVTVNTAGVNTNKNIGVEVLKVTVPVLLSITIYMMILLYGQTIFGNFIADKASKVMETLLVAVSSYALVFGKLAAICLSAVIQFSFWIICLILGLSAGIFITGQQNPQAMAGINQFLQSIKDAAGSDAFSIHSFVFAFAALVLGFALFCMVAGVLGSLAGKTDDAQPLMGIFTVITVLCYLVSFANTDGNNEQLIRILRYIPFTAAFLVPADVFVGKMTIWEGILSLSITLISSVIIAVFAGKIYSLMILYKGNVPKAKDLLRMLKNR